jgi:hypothetical protein
MNNIYKNSLPESKEKAYKLNSHNLLSVSEMFSIRGGDGSSSPQPPLVR